MDEPEELIHQAYRYELAPTEEEAEFLTNCCGASRFWFNYELEIVKTALDLKASGQEDVFIPWSYKDFNSKVFKGKAAKDAACPWRKEVVCGSYQAGTMALTDALRQWSLGRNVGFPEYKKRGDCHESVIFQNPRFVDHKHLFLDKRIYGMKTKESMKKMFRLLDRDEHAKIVWSTVQKENGRWFISFTVRRSKKQRRARHPDTAIGMDLGLTHLAVLSDGRKINNDRPLKTNIKAIKRLQRKQNRQLRKNNPGNYDDKGVPKKGKKTWHKSVRALETERKLQEAHLRVRNLRHNRSHELTSMLTREYGVIGVEGLSVTNLIKNRKLSFHIADAAWGMILRQIAYKAAWTDGTQLVVADRFHPSSKTCSACDHVRAKLDLHQRVFECDNPECKLVIDRDINASLNLEALAVTKTKGTKHVASVGEETLNGHREPDITRLCSTKQACGNGSMKCQACIVAAGGDTDTSP